MEISARFLAFTEYGVQWVLWLLIALSVISLGVALERLWHFATYHPDPEALVAEIRARLRSGPARRASREAQGAAEALDAAFEGAKASERLRLERNLAFLGTLGSNAPFVGLFGTVLGIIKAFHDLAGNQAGGPAVVMAGISEALVATAVGLMVAIPAVVAFNYFNRRVRSVMTQVDWMAHLAFAEVKAGLGQGAETGADSEDLPVGARSSGASLQRTLLLAAAGGLSLFLVGILIWQGGRRTTPSIPKVQPVAPLVQPTKSPEPSVPVISPSAAPAPAPMPNVNPNSASTLNPPMVTAPPVVPVPVTAPVVPAPITAPVVPAPVTAPVVPAPVTAPPESVKAPAGPVLPKAPVQGGSKGTKPPIKVWKKKKPLGAGQPAAPGASKPKPPEPPKTDDAKPAEAVP